MKQELTHGIATYLPDRGRLRSVSRLRSHNLRQRIGSRVLADPAWGRNLTVAALCARDESVVPNLGCLIHPDILFKKLYVHLDRV